MTRTVSLRQLCSGADALFTDGDWVETPHISDAGNRLLQTGNVGVGVYREQGFRFISDESFDALRCTEVVPGDVLICRLADPVGRACLAPGLSTRMLTSVDVCIARPAPGISDRRFLVYYLSSNRYLGEIEAIARGGTRQRISRDQLGSVRVPLPPVAEQRAIADFLDTETARIDALITKKRRLIEVLDERLGVERDGAFSTMPGIPLKRLLRAPMAYGVLVPRFVDPPAGVPMVRTLNLDNRGWIQMGAVIRIETRQSVEFQRTRLVAGDLVLSVVGSMGRAAVAGRESSGANLNRPLARIQPMQELPSRLLWHWTQSSYFANLARVATSGGTAQPTLNLGDLAQFRVGISDEPSDWDAAFHLLEAATDLHDRTSDNLTRQIDLLVEHRQALITAAVTGELEIPGTA